MSGSYDTDREYLSKVFDSERSPTRLEAYQERLKQGASQRPSTTARVVSAYKQDVGPSEAGLGIVRRALSNKKWPDGTPYSSEDYARTDNVERASKLRNFQVPDAVTAGEKIADSLGSVLSQASDPTNLALIAATKKAPASLAAAAGGLYEGTNQYMRDVFSSGKANVPEALEKGVTGALIAGGIDKALPASSVIDSSVIGLGRPVSMEALEDPVDDNVTQNVKTIGRAVVDSPGGQRLAEIGGAAKKRIESATKDFIPTALAYENPFN
jgi:hypothetical protein